MSATTLFRLSGIGLFLGGLLATLGTLPILIIGDDPTQSASAVMASVRVLGAIFIVLGLPGMYLRQAQRAGILGLVGFAVTMVAILLQGVASDTLNALVAPVLAVQAPSILQNTPAGLSTLFLVGGLLVFLGGLLLGIATLRASLFSRWAAGVLIVGSVLSLVGNFLLPVIGTIGVALFLMGLAWLGIDTATSRPTEIPGPLPAAMRA